VEIAFRSTSRKNSLRRDMSVLEVKRALYLKMYPGYAIDRLIDRFIKLELCSLQFIVMTDNRKLFVRNLHSVNIARNNFAEISKNLARSENNFVGLSK